MLPILLTLPLALCTSAVPVPFQATGQSMSSTSATSPGADTGRVEGSLRIDRGEEEALWIPPAERLKLKIRVDMPIIGYDTIGTVEMTAGVEPFVSMFMSIDEEDSDEEATSVGWVTFRAKASALGFKMDNTLSTRFLPQDWPRTFHTEVQTGRKNRKRELMIGLRDGAWTSQYRADEHCSGCDLTKHSVSGPMPWDGERHCDGCNRPEHRVWGDPTLRPVPPHTLDILGTVTLARNLVRNGEEELVVVMAQKSQLWEMSFRAAKTKNIKVAAGTFRCRKVLLSVRPPAGEDPHGKEYSGLFGIKGDLTLWMHETTGIPVLIEGEIPAGVLSLHAKIGLASFSGTPAALRSLR